MRQIIRSMLGYVLIAVMLSASPLASAQGQSGGTGKIVVGNQPGGATDNVARLLSPAFSTALGRPYVVENRTGASGNIAAEHVAKSAPDGNTILLVFNSHATMAPLFPNLQFDPIKDFASVGTIADTPYLVVARPNIEVNDLKELIAKAKRDNSTITVGTPGQGTPQHLLVEQIKKANGVNMIAVQYKGSAPAQADVMGGHVDITFVTPSLSASLVKAGKLKLLAVTSKARLAEFPDAQTATEAGVPSLAGAGVWLALLVPAKTPPSTVAQLNKVLNETLRSPDVKARLQAIGMTPLGGTPEQAARAMADEQATWTTVIREANLKIDQ